MKVIFNTCYGGDVHKRFLIVTIIKSTAFSPKRTLLHPQQRHQQFQKWRLENDHRDVCMESIDKYWIPVFNFLKDQINITIAIPNGARLSIAIKTAPRIPSRSVIVFALDWFSATSFPAKTPDTT